MCCMRAVAIAQAKLGASGHEPEEPARGAWRSHPWSRRAGEGPTEQFVSARVDPLQRAPQALDIERLSCLGLTH